jgi:hypothetical protein
MSVEGWIASVTGVIIAVGTAILVVYTPFGPAARRTGAALGAFLWVRLGQVWRRLSSGLRSDTTWIVVTLILLAVWSLASPSLFGVVAARPLWSWTARVVAGAASALAFVLAYRSQPAMPVVGLPIPPRPADLESDALETASRRLDLLRQVYALSAAMLKHVPDSPGLVAWDDVQHFNGLIYRLLADGLDLKAFEIPFTWTFQPGGTSERFIDGPRVARQLEGLITYARAAGVDRELSAADQTEFD